MLWSLKDIYEADLSAIRYVTSLGESGTNSPAKNRIKERRISNLPSVHCPSAKVCRKDCELHDKKSNVSHLISYRTKNSIYRG